jgi:hypothetical protein
MKIPFAQRDEPKRGFRKPPRAELTVTASLPCEVMVRADYDAHAMSIELTNVRRLGRVHYRLASAAFSGVMDDVARYMLGVDDDLERRARR